MAFDDIRKVYRDYKTRFPNGNQEQFRTYVHRNFPQYERQLKQLEEQAKKSVEQETNRLKEQYRNRPKVTISNPDVDNLYDKRETDVGKKVRQELGSESGVKAKTPQSPKISMKDRLSGAYKSTKNIGGKALQAAPAIIQGYETIKNWNAPGSDWGTRLLDATGVVGAAGASTIGALTGHPVAGTVGASGVAAFDASRAQKRREDNIKANVDYNDYLYNQLDENTRNQLSKLSPEDRQKYFDLMMAKQHGVSNPRVISSSTAYDGSLEPSAEDIALAQQYQQNATNNVTPSMYSANPQIINLPQAPIINGGDNNGGLPPIAQSQSNGGNVSFTPQNVTGGAAPIYSQQQYYQDVADVLNPKLRTGYEVTSEEQAQAQAVLNGQGYVSQQDMYNRLIDLQNAQQNAINKDFRYQGGVIPTQGYDYDRNKLEAAQSADYVNSILASDRGQEYRGHVAQDYLDNQRIAYEQQIAAQAGVPYEHYKEAMMERQKNNIKNDAQNQINMLTFQANQANDRKSMLEYLQKAQEAKIKADQAIRNTMISGYNDMRKASIAGEYNQGTAGVQGQYNLLERQMQNQNAWDIAKLNNEKDIIVKQMEIDNPIARTNAAARFIGSAAYMMPQERAAFLSMFSPEQLESFFGRRLTAEQINAFLNIPAGNTNAMQNFFRQLRGLPNAE